MKIDRDAVWNFFRRTFDPHYEILKLQQSHEQRVESTDQYIDEIENRYKEHYTSQVNLTEDLATKQALLEAQKLHIM